VWTGDAIVWSVRSFTPEAQKRLLQCGNIDARRAVVIGLAISYTDGIPDDVANVWREAVPQTRADDHWLPRALQQESELLVEWVKGWGVRADVPSEPFESFPDALLPDLERLPIERRRELLADVGQRKSIVIDEVVARLVADDLAMIEILFQQPERRRFQRAALSGELDDAWLERAAVARRAGWTPDQIVAAQIAGVGVTIISGPESAHWESRAADFRSRLQLATTGLEKELWAAGKQICESRRDEALAEERREAVFGLDW
jgi:hypothetical protein